MRSLIRDRRRWLVVLAAAAVAAVLLWRGVPPARLSLIWPIDLGKPASWFVDRRLAELGGDRALCTAVLIAPHVAATPVADATNADGCGWHNGMRVASVGGARLTVDKLTCELTAALGLWLIHEVQPEAQRRLGSAVVAVRHAGGYACRNIQGSAQHRHLRSEHASANALDIKGFTLADGREISVLRHWLGEGPEAKFLHQIHARACPYFRVAIGPAYNAAHRDHFHYDRGRFRTCR